MKNRFFPTCLLCCLVLLSGVALAAPRVCLVQLLDGQATVNGKPVKGAALGEQGQTLKIDSKSKVRVQLIRANKEIVLTGPLTVKIDEKTLAAKGRVIARQGVHIIEDIGNVNAAGAGRSRSEPYTTLGLKIELIQNEEFPHGVLKQTYVDSEFFRNKVDPESYSGRINLKRFKEDEPFYSSEAVAIEEVSFSPQNRPTVIELEKGYLLPNHRYIFSVVRYKDSSDDSGLFYSRRFKLLSPQEKTTLELLEAEMRKQAEASKSILPLLRMAQIYNDEDQMEKSEELLRESYQSQFRDRKDTRLGESILGRWNETRRALDLPYKSKSF